MEELISIIVPIYNVENYLNKCINSIVNQTYENLEILLIDDGSTDKSGKICDEWQKKDKRIQVIHKKNGGLSDARNIGLENSTGNYISFVDSDDYVEEDIIKNLYNNMLESNSDIASGGLISEAFNRQSHRYCEKNYIADSEEMIRRMLTKNDIFVAVWGKLYKKKLFNEIRFPVGKINEDLAVTYLLFDKAERISHINKAEYHYIQRAESIGNSKLRKEHLSIIEYKEEILKFVETKYSKLVEEAEIYLIETLNLITMVCKKNNLNKEYKELKGKLKMYKIRILKNSKMSLKLKIRSMLIIFIGI